MSIVANRTRTAINDLIIDLEWNFRYYTSKSDNFHKWAFGLRFGILAGVVFEASLAYPLSQLERGWIGLTVVGGILGLLAIWDALNHYSRDSGILKLTALTCDELKTEAYKLLRDVETGRMETEEAELRLESIYSRWGKATDKVLSAFDNRLSKKSEKEAIKITENRIAATN